MSRSSAAGVAHHPALRERAELSPILLGLMNMIAVWILRRRQRRALATLDDHLLNDVGLSREQARREAAKPFWKR